MTSLAADDDEVLTTGWEPDVPASDSIVRAAVLVHGSWAVTLARAMGRPWHDEAGWAAGQTTDRVALANWVVLKQPLLDVSAVVADAGSVMPDTAPYVLLSPWPTGDLRPLGLLPVGHPPLMYRPATPDATIDVSADLHVTWITEVADLVEAERVLVDGYPVPELQPFQPGTLYDPSILEEASTRIALGRLDGEPVATAAVHVANGLNLVESVAVMPQARGRGAGRAVTAAVTAAIADQPSVLIASDDGQPVYERLGYLRIERWTIWLRPGT
jgi:hypothetical protein